MAFGLRRCVLATAIVACAALVSARADAAPRTIIGIVVTADGDPIPAAKITLLDAKGRPLGTATTDAKGAWRIAIEQEDKGQLRALVHVEGLPDSSTSVEPDDLVVKTTLVAGASDVIDVEVKGDKK